MLLEQPRPPSYLTRIQGVPLLPQERVNYSFTPADGISQEPSDTGRLLVMTNQRIISFSHGQNGDETVLVPVEELNGVVVKLESRGSGSLLQEIMLIVAGALIYLIGGYWLVGRLPEWDIPIIGLDFWALVLLAGLIWGGWLIARHYFTKDPGQVTFQGGNWAFSFPYTGDKPAAEVHQIIRTAFISRNQNKGHWTEHPL